MRIMSRKSVIAVAIMCSMMTITTPTMAGTSIIINGKTATTTVAPYQTNGTTMVPLRLISESLGATVSYDKATKVVTIKKGHSTITMTVGKYQAKVNGRTIVMNQAVEVKNGTTMVPVRIVAEAFNCDVIYNKAKNAVTITTSDKASQKGTGESSSGYEGYVPTLSNTDTFGREIRTTNLPRNASRFPYIAEGVPNWCYEQQPWDDNYWGSLYSTDLIDEGASKVAAFPSNVYEPSNSLSTVIADNYETIDNFIKAQCCVDYRTIDEATYCNAIANGVDLRTTGSGTLQGVKAAAKKFVDGAKKYKVIIETEYQILPETAWVMNSAPFNTLNFSVYMRVTPKNIEGGYYNSWGTMSVYHSKYNTSSIKTNQVYEGIVTYTLIKQDDGTWKLNNTSNDIWGQIDPLCDILNGVAPDKKNLAGRENEFNYTWTKDENKYYTRYQKDCVTPE